MPSSTPRCTNDHSSDALFGPQHVISALAHGGRSVVAADFDGDGSLDVATASMKDHRISWYKNIDNGTSFGPQQILDQTAMGAWSVWAEDLDNDGDPDLLSVSMNNNQLCWYRNEDGKGTFSECIVITTQCVCGMSVVTADFDQDGNVDLLVSMMNSNTIAWYRNTDGTGTFSSEIYVDKHSNRAMDAIAVDLNKDGYPDIVTANAGDNAIVFYLNHKNSTFSPKKIVSSDAMYAYSVIAGDFDGDGWIDLASASQDDGKIAWYKNLMQHKTCHHPHCHRDGIGLFSTEKVLSRSASGARSIITADFNKDGHLDLAIASQDNNQIGWFANVDGLGNFSQFMVLSSTTGGGKNDRRPPLLIPPFFTDFCCVFLFVLVVLVVLVVLFWLFWLFWLAWHSTKCFPSRHYR